jgi:hypothetical protein
MTKDQMQAEPSRGVSTSTISDISSFKPLAFRLELQSMPILLTVLANVARLGCSISHVSAKIEFVELAILAPPHVAHRVESCLAQIIGVLAISLFSPPTSDPDSP